MASFLTNSATSVFNLISVILSFGFFLFFLGIPVLPINMMCTLVSFIIHYIFRSLGKFGISRAFHCHYNFNIYYNGKIKKWSTISVSDLLTSIGWSVWLSKSRYFYFYFSSLTQILIRAYAVSFHRKIPVVCIVPNELPFHPVTSKFVF